MVFFFVPFSGLHEDVMLTIPGDEKRWAICQILRRITPPVLVPNCINVLHSSSGVGFVSPQGVEFSAEEKDLLTQWVEQVRDLRETAAFIINRMGRGMEQLLEHSLHGELGKESIQLLGVSVMVCLAGRLIDDPLWTPLTRRFTLHERTMATVCAYLEDRVEVGNMMTFGEPSFLSRMSFERCGVHVIEQPPEHEESVEEITIDESVEMGSVEIVEID